MYKALTTMLAVAFLATAANGQTSLNLTVKACDGSGSSDVTVAPGGSLDYAVVGELGDSTTQGLATVGFDLLLHDAAGAIAMDLPRANPPSGPPMSNFAFPDGLNNPTDGTLDSAVGYGGTPSRGKLLQCGGAQNTILNNTGTFLLGTPILNVAQPGSPEVLLAGTLTAPAAEGDYTLAIKATCVRIDSTQAALSSDTLCTSDVDCPAGAPGTADDEVCKGHPFAMLIDQDLTTYFSVVSADIPEPTHLAIHVVAGAGDPCAAPINLDPGASDPPGGSIDAGIAHLINDAGTVLTPQSVILGFTASPAGVAPGEFTVTQKTGGGSEVPGPAVITVTPGLGNTAEITFATRIAAGAWTKVAFNGGQYCIGSMPGDSSQNGETTAADIDALITCLNNGTCGPWACDVDRFGACTGADLAMLVNVLNKAGTFTEAFAPLGASLCP